jgi:hypothetical protein
MSVAVADDLQGNPIVREDLGGIKFCNAFRVNGFLAGDEDASFRDIMVGDCKDGVVAL